MIATSVKFKNHPCFKDHWSGLDGLPPVTLIIGKNNTGKSHLLQIIKCLCGKQARDFPWDLYLRIPLRSEAIKNAFPPNHSNASLGGDLWYQHGALFVDKTLLWKRETGIEDLIEFEEGTFHRDGVRNDTAEARLSRLATLLPDTRHLLHGKIFKHLLADRDIQPEVEGNNLVLTSNGHGATNIVRRYINSSETRFKRELIQIEMLRALNEIFASDGHFQEITVKHHDGADPEKPNNIWEIYLKQEHKGLVSLSASGSGLKTIFLVLLHLLVVPAIEGKHLIDYVFAFEELENNLHPSLLRNLLRYIQNSTSLKTLSSAGATPHFFLTTHSNVALDYFAGSNDSQVIHVSHDGRSARTQTINQSQKLLSILWDLGTRPSDLLQANGIIWVEGPSDRIYMNKWVELFSQGKFREGRHYQCAFYGGGLLANLQAASDEDADADLINLLKINPNVIVVSDSDRKSKSHNLKPRVRRIREEFTKLDTERSLHWILEAREIENYLTGDLIKRFMNHPAPKLPDPDQFQSFFRKDGETNYLEKAVERKTFDKSDLAVLATSHMKIEDVQGRFDLDCTMRRILSIIEVWNR
jgi:hypothetical protein